jgi:hypothetical protein
LNLTEQIPTTPKDIRKFGLLFTCVFLLLAAYSAYRGGGAWPWLLGVATFFLLTGLFLHFVLRPIYIGWMKFAFLLGWVNTRLILGVFFYVILTPIGLIMRLFGRDPLHRKFDRKATTYWEKREQAEFKRERYERLF